MLAILFSLPGCIIDENYEIHSLYWVEVGYVGYEMANEYEKNADNETISETLHELVVDFSETYPYDDSLSIEYFWMDPGDGTEIIIVNANDNNIINYTYTGYGAFLYNEGFIDNEGNEYTMWTNGSDRAPSIRSGEFVFSQSGAQELANLYIDAPHPFSQGPPERMHIESEITNSFDFPFTSTDITWTLIGPNGDQLATHTETIAFLESYTWDFWIEENVPLGAMEIIIESSENTSISQNTNVRMGYSGFPCSGVGPKECNRF